MKLPKIVRDRAAIVAFIIALPLVGLEVVWLWPLISFAWFILR